MSRMKVKHLESILEDVETFEEPNYMLEQYKTSAHLAAHMIHAAHGAGDIEDKVVLDLGCGTGILAIASQVMGSAYTVGMDLDEGALATAARNCEEIGADVDLIRLNVADGDDGLPVHVGPAGPPEGDEAAADAAPAAAEEGAGATNAAAVAAAAAATAATTLMGRGLVFDTVVMNPPFGTRVKGIDMIFLERALDIAQTTVYSLHKTTTRAHIVKKAKQWGVDVAVVAEMKFDIPAMYKFHKKKSANVAVDMLQFRKREAEQGAAANVGEGAAAAAARGGGRGARGGMLRVAAASESKA